MSTNTTDSSEEEPALVVTVARSDFGFESTMVNNLCSSCYLLTDTLIH